MNTDELEQSAATESAGASVPGADRGGADPSDDAGRSDAFAAEMTDLLVKAVRALGAAGDPTLASRISGKAWWLLKDYPRQAERINGTMHYLAKLEAAQPHQRQS